MPQFALALATVAVQYFCLLAPPPAAPTPRVLGSCLRAGLRQLSLSGAPGDVEFYGFGQRCEAIYSTTMVITETGPLSPNAHAVNEQKKTL